MPSSNEDPAAAGAQGGARGAVEFCLKTWSGRFLALNALVFLGMSIESGSIWMPTDDVLMAAGAKDAVRLASGDWWRLITPMFVHIGFLHFLINSYALKTVGPQIELVLRGPSFWALYLVAGISGNIVSAAFNLQVSAGASGAIFGLIGAGLVIESALQRHLERSSPSFRISRNYLSLTLVNLTLGAVIPGIDNSAHIGGLISGMAITLATLRIKPNRLVHQRRFRGYMILFALGITAAPLAYIGVSPQVVKRRFIAGGEDAFQRLVSANDQDDRMEAGRESYYLFSRAAELSPADRHMHFARVKVLIMLGEMAAVRDDLTELARDSNLKQDFDALANTLESIGRAGEAEEVERFVR